VIVLIGGPIAVGKTSLAEGLSASLPADVVKVRIALSEVTGVPVTDRRRLQTEGAAFDRRTGGRWLLNYLEENAPADSDRHVVVDALRTVRQTEPILVGLSKSVLVYLSCNEEERAHRYSRGALTDPLKRRMNFHESMRHETEARAAELASLAHIVIETDALTAPEVLSEALKRLRLFEEGRGV
jgi:shikimate kinase